MHQPLCSKRSAHESTFVCEGIFPSQRIRGNEWHSGRSCGVKSGRLRAEGEAPLGRAVNQRRLAAGLRNRASSVCTHNIYVGYHFVVRPRDRGALSDRSADAFASGTREREEVSSSSFLPPLLPTTGSRARTLASCQHPRTSFGIDAILHLLLST